jgi:uncharacterized protein (DUF1697 family)
LRAALFLRAVNLKGRPLPMADFKTILADVGLRDIQTVGASGNAVVEAAAADTDLETRVELALAQKLGFTTEVFARSDLEMKVVLRANPFEIFATLDPGRLMTVFLKEAPDKAKAAALQAAIAGREEVATGLRCLYATFPDGAGRSKLTMAVIERALGCRGTARNWNTVRRMAELTAGG